MSRNDKTITDETLLGYLLMALPEDEQWRIEQIAMVDPVLTQRIADLRDLLDPIREDQQEFEPRSDLTAKTMAAIQASEESLSVKGKSAATMTPPLYESSRSTKLAWLDSLVTLAAGIVILSFLLPSVWFSREASRRVACASNMREIGNSFMVFAAADENRRLPQIDPQGPLSFAGIYGIRLNDAKLLESTGWLWCPASDQLESNQTIPSIQAFLAASPATQQNWRNFAGGNYAYNLGNLVDGEYFTPSMTGQSHFAVMGDSLLATVPSPSAGALHGQNAANVLFDDGRIQYLRIDRMEGQDIDNPYLNRVMQQAVGIGLDDSCLGRSYQSPFRVVKFQ